MKSLARLTLLLLVPAALSCDRNGLQLTTWSAYRNPVLREEVKNPDILAEGPVWYLYSDGTPTDIIRVLSSTDLVEWGDLDPVFDEDTKPGFIPGGTVSAPSVLRIADRCLLYYGLAKSPAESGIGVASAASPTGPWTDHGALLTAEATGLTGLGHPFAFEADGAPWLAFSAGDGIWLVRLSATGLETASGSEAIRVVEGALTEPVFLQEAGAWHLLCTTGDESTGASSTASITDASAAALTGPYDNWKNLLVRSAKFAGPGSPSRPVTDGNGDSWLFYNAYDLSSVSTGRTLMLDRIHWDGDSAPWIRGNASSYYTDAPIITQ